MDKTIGFIGCGNMAQAMIGGIISSGLTSSDKVIASNPSVAKLELMKSKYNIIAAQDNIEVAKASDILILAIKPYKYAEIITEIKEYIKPNVVIVTIAAGVTIEQVEKNFGRKIKVIRTMPNTAALVGESMSALCYNTEVEQSELSDVFAIFKSFGKVETIEERLMDVIPSISGSSTAYVYMFIEALADGGVLRGLQRDKAYTLAAQAVLGAAKMVLETGEHPGSLKDKVCSPGGTTIEAVYTLEKNNFRGTIISAMESCTEKAIKMSKGQA